jgi:hypothetical protein
MGGVPGFPYTVTFTFLLSLHPFASVTVTVYEPEAEVETFVIDGFCKDDVKLFGPVQL